MKRAGITLFVLTALLSCAWLLWNPLHGNGVNFSCHSNAIWVENQWYSGYKKDGSLVSDDELLSFVDNLRQAKVKQVYLAMPPVNCNGTLRPVEGRLFMRLQQLTPEVTYLPWISGNPANFTGSEEQWNRFFVEAIYELSSEGFKGVHLCFEPVDSGDGRYLRMLAYLHEQLGEQLILSHTTRRMFPLKAVSQVFKSYYWDEAYYKACMRHTDESVLLCYDTALGSKKLYAAFIKSQIHRALTLAGELGNHRVRVGLPAYEGGRFSNKQVENLQISLQVVESLKVSSSAQAAFAGLSVYKYEHLDKNEWSTLHRFCQK